MTIGRVFDAPADASVAAAAAAATTTTDASLVMLSVSGARVEGFPAARIKIKTSSNKRQATSNQAASNKQQATSSKQPRQPVTKRWPTNLPNLV
jgi:hypothetical protein